MNILMITENDPAGMGIAFTNAINRNTDHSCRLITKTTRYNFDFDKDIHIPDLAPDDFDQIVQLLKNADIIHFHILSDENTRLGALHVKDYIKGKAIVHHHHGHPDFRRNPEKYRSKYALLNRRILVSTPDLLGLLPEAIWQPNIIPIDDIKYSPNYMPVSDCIIIGQSVTQKDLKNTTELEDAVAQIQQNDSRLKVRLDIIEHTRHHECLNRKNRCHVLFDHMQGYFGVSSLEGLSQGKPVIAGLDDWNIDRIKAFTGADQLPWVIARTEDELCEAINMFLDHTSLIEAKGRESRRFMDAHWAEPQVIEPLMASYEKL